MRVLLAPTGSRGDIQPSFALALALKQAGHQVTVAAAPNYRAWADELGLPFVACGVDLEALMREHAAMVGQGARATAKGMQLFFSKDIPHQFEALAPLVADADVVVGATLQIAAKTLCEKYRRPFCYLTFCTQLLPSAMHPPTLLPFHGMPRWANRIAWKLNAKLRSSLVIAPINAGRRKLGLDPYALVPYGSEAADLTIVATDHALAPVPTDVRVPFRQTGFLFLDQPEPLPPEVQAFLDAGPAPVYIGFGSMTRADALATTRVLVDGVARAGCRAILSAGWANLGESALPSTILRVGALSHQRLFPRVAGVMHHGGSGTTSTAARAGVPQLLVPHVLDQAYWGRRVSSAGLGPAPIPIRALTVDRVARGLDALSRNMSYAQAASSMRERISADGAAAAIDALATLTRECARRA